MRITGMGFVASFPPGGMGCDYLEAEHIAAERESHPRGRGHETANGDYRRRHPEAARAIAEGSFGAHTALERLA